MQWRLYSVEWVDLSTGLRGPGAMENKKNVKKNNMRLAFLKLYIPSSEYLKLPCQPIHIPTNPKQAKLSQKINNLEIAYFLSVLEYTTLISGGSCYFPLGPLNF
jgi:hypothetical protein